MRIFPFKKGSLSKQRVKKRKKKAVLWKSRVTSFSAILCSALIVFYFFQNTHEEEPNKVEKKHGILPSWEITFSSNLSSTNKETVAEELPEILKTKGSLQEIAKEIQSRFFFSKTTLLHVSPSKLLVRLEDRTPEFIVFADKPRLVSIEREVYGEPTQISRNLPELHGVLDSKRESYVFTESEALALSPEEQGRLLEAQTILRLAEKHSLEVGKITYVEYRGFKLNFRHERTEVFLGRKPFQAKFTKLLQIKKQLKKEDGKSRRIELDYDGKAFIKTLKTGDKVDS